MDGKALHIAEEVDGQLYNYVRHTHEPRLSTVHHPKHTNPKKKTIEVRDSVHEL